MSAGAAPGERVSVGYCPYCGEEDLRPVPEPPGAWQCRGCARIFTVRFGGLAGDLLAAVDASRAASGDRGDLNEARGGTTVDRMTGDGQGEARAMPSAQGSGRRGDE